MLQQRTARLGRGDAGPPAREQRHAQRILHVADAGRSSGERKVRARGAVGDAPGLGHVPKQAEIGEIEAHENGVPSRLAKLAFRKCQLRRTISTPYFRLWRSNYAAAHRQYVWRHCGKHADWIGTTPSLAPVPGGFGRA